MFVTLHFRAAGWRIMCRMDYPTPDEIRLAAAAINRDGPEAETTARLCALVLSNPHLRSIVNRLMPALGRSELRAPGEALLAGAIATGLNYGLRIHEIRSEQSETSSVSPPGHPLYGE